MEFKEFLKRGRLSRNMSTRLLADFIGVSHTTIGAWESGKYEIPMDMALRVCIFFEESFTLNPVKVIDRTKKLDTKTEVRINKMQLDPAQIVLSIGSANKPLEETWVE